MDPNTTDAALASLYPTTYGDKQTPAAAAAAAAAPAPAAAAAAAPSAAPSPSKAQANDDTKPGGDAAPERRAEPRVDPELQALRQDAAECLYSRPEAERTVPENLLEAAVGAQVEVDGKMVDFTEDLARHGVAELRTLAADLNLSTTDVAAMTEGLLFAETIKGDEQKTIAARESAVDLLNAEHGEDAALAARAARAFVAKNPKLTQMLVRTGTGDSPQVVAVIARRALALHKAGKLTVPRPAGVAQRTTAQAFYTQTKG